MASETTPEVDNPKVPSNPSSIHPTTEDATSTRSLSSSGGKVVESKREPAAEVSTKKTDVDDGAAVTDIQKKIKRAERFGTSVQLSEKEKRNTRAERFGTGPTISKVDSSKHSEDLKKKRAERFGIVQSDPADEELKKKARLARFGSTPQSDSVDEDKKKARAIRFSQLDSGSKKNGTKNIEEKTAIDGEASEGT